jgi:hypothetical protein
MVVQVFHSTKLHGKAEIQCVVQLPDSSMGTHLSRGRQAFFFSDLHKDDL